jgi:hypothetical protein
MKFLKVFRQRLPLAALGTVIFLLSFKAVTKIESKICYGQGVTTESLHNAVIGAHDGNVYRQFANAWFRKYTLAVSAPSGWHFTGKPFVNCLRENEGAFAWNNFAGSPDRFIITQSGPNYIEATVWAGSRSIDINLACEATKD